MALAVLCYQNICSMPMDRLHELENMRRSLAMLEPGTKALDRKRAMSLIAEVQELEVRMRDLRRALRSLLDDEGPVRSTH